MSTEHVYETFEHTADFGIRARAPDLATLFADAARGLFSLVVADLDQVRPLQAAHFRVTGLDPTYLLFDWLNELLYTFDTQRIVFSNFTVQLKEAHLDGLVATAQGEKLDPKRHRLGHEIKAITYHALRVERVAKGWLAEVIVDV